MHVAHVVKVLSDIDLVHNELRSSVAHCLSLSVSACLCLQSAREHGQKKRGSRTHIKVRGSVRLDFFQVCALKHFDVRTCMAHGAI